MWLTMYGKQVISPRSEFSIPISKLGRGRSSPSWTRRWASGMPLATEEIVGVLDVAVAKARDLDKLVEARLQEDWNGRNVEVR